MSLKLCPGEHQVNAPCVTCDEDAKRCDLCWEENPDDQHDDLRPYRVFPEDGEPTTLRLCKPCYREARTSEPYDPPKDDERDWGRP